MAPTAIQSSSNPICNGDVTLFPPRLYSIHDPPSLTAFQNLCSTSTRRKDCPLASSILSNVPIYELSTANYSDTGFTATLQDEWNHILLSGPGVIVLKGLFSDRALLSRVNTLFDAIIQSELTSSRGDHFATDGSGKNARIWNSFQKHGMHDPESFISYYSNPWIALMCEAWLGPAYRITAQVNIVKPGGMAQVSHRDYHLGFQTAEACARYPKAMQVASQLLTLQAGIAHSDMPLESGPTRFLPFSQLFEEGFMAYRLPEFQRYFEEHYVSLPLEIG